MTSQFTQTELLEIVENTLHSSDFELQGHELEPLEEKTGLLGDHYILRIKIKIKNSPKAEQILTYFAKFLPKLEEAAKFATEVGAFQKEIFTYELFREINKNNGNFNTIKFMPKCYFTKENKCLVLTNLKSKNFKCVNKQRTLTLQEVRTVLAKLAIFHASSLVYEEIASKLEGKKVRLGEKYAHLLEESFFNDKPNFINDKGIQASIKGVLGEIKMFKLAETLPKSNKPFKEVAERTLFQIYNYVKPSKDFRNVISHGDLWSTNFMLKYKDEVPIDCRLIDFQCTRYVPPAQDVLSLIFLTTTRAFRKRHLYELLGFYYYNLEKAVIPAGFQMKDLITFDNFLESCEFYKAFAVVQTAIYFPLILIKTEDIEKYFSDAELYKKALMEDRTCMIQEFISKDENYSTRLRESMDDLYEICLRLENV